MGALRARSRLHAHGSHVGEDGGAVTLQGRLHEGRVAGVVAGQDARVGLDDGDRHAVAGVDLGQLRADGTATHDEQAAGQLARCGALAVVPELDLVQALDIGDARAAAHGDDDVAGVEHAFAALGQGHAHGAGAVEPGGAADRFSADAAIALLVAGIGRVVGLLAADHVVAEVGGLLPGEVAARVVHGRRVEQGLAGHAGPEGAGAAEEVAVHDGHAVAAFASELEGGLTGRAGADDDEVECVLGVGHGCSPYGRYHPIVLHRRHDSMCARPRASPGAVSFVPPTPGRGLRGTRP